MYVCMYVCTYRYPTATIDQDSMSIAMLSADIIDAHNTAGSASPVVSDSVGVSVQPAVLPYVLGANVAAAATTGDDGDDAKSSYVLVGRVMGV